MAGTRRRTKKKAAAPVRPALGNDPFARGAAPRPVAPRPSAPAAPSVAAESLPAPAPMAAPPSAEEAPRAPEPGRAPLETVPATEAPASPRSGASTLRALDSIEARLDAAIHDAEARLAAAAGEGDAALHRAREDLRTVLSTLLPALKARFSGFGDLLRMLEPPSRLERFGMDPNLVERSTPLVELLYATWWRTEARGLDAVPAAGPAVVVANHAGLLPWDALVLRHGLRRDHPAHRALRPLLDDDACDRPVSGAIAVRLGAVRASPEAAARILASGDLVGVFPEGSVAEAKPWRERYKVGHFGRGGFVKVALRAGAPIIPCAIVGSEEAAPAIARTGWLADLLRLPLLATTPTFRLPSAGLLPLPSRWSLRFGPAIDLGGAGPSSAEDPALVADAVQRTRAAIQAMLDEDVAARRSIFL